MTSGELRNKFLTFFAHRQHAVIPSASLVPKNDPSVLFNTAGMQPLIPYLLGEEHPLGKRLVSAQKCVRTGDIEEVGNHKNLTFFEMLGNWSLGDYFKKEAINWSYEFLTSTTDGLGLDPKRLYITVFEGDENAPRDMEAFELWKEYVPEHRIYFLPAKNNWWSPGDNGPCGPDTEIFYDVTEEGLGDLTHEAYVKADDSGEVVEIWNNVFMQYEKKDGKVVGKLASVNVDTGSGLERVLMIVQGKKNVYETDVFSPSMEIIKKHADSHNERSARIIADHMRSALMIVSDGVFPGNKDQGYIVRRLIRRAVVQAQACGLDVSHFIQILESFVAIYETEYPEVTKGSIDIIMQEVGKFQKTLVQGMKEFERGVNPFILATTYGFPIEITKELADEKNIAIDIAAFEEDMKAHQEASRAGAKDKFKGGLANTNEQTTKLHTAHHVLLAALQHVLSKDIHQKGSNITEERLRIDFNFDRKITPEEIQNIEKFVQDAIDRNLRVVKREMKREEAEKSGAEMEFGTKYPDVVTVYFIEDNDGNVLSKEFCGGPHVTELKTLGHFKITKEEAVASGIRRIKATLQ